MCGRLEVKKENGAGRRGKKEGKQGRQEGKKRGRREATERRKRKKQIWEVLKEKEEIHEIGKENGEKATKEKRRERKKKRYKLSHSHSSIISSCYFQLTAKGVLKIKRFLKSIINPSISTTLPFNPTTTCQIWAAKHCVQNTRLLILWPTNTHKPVNHLLRLLALLFLSLPSTRTSKSVFFFLFFFLFTPGSVGRGQGGGTCLASSITRVVNR